MNKALYIILSYRNFDSFKESTTKIFLGKKNIALSVTVSILYNEKIKRSWESSQIQQKSIIFKII